MGEGETTGRHLGHNPASRSSSGPSSPTDTRSWQNKEKNATAKRVGDQMHAEVSRFRRAGIKKTRAKRYRQRHTLLSREGAPDLPRQSSTLRTRKTATSGPHFSPLASSPEVTPITNILYNLKAGGSSSHATFCNAIIPRSRRMTPPASWRDQNVPHLPLGRLPVT